MARVTRNIGLSLGADIGDGGVGPISASRAAKQIGTGHPGFLRHSDSDDHFSLPDPRPAKKLRDRLFVYHTNFARADAVAAQTFTTIPTWEIAAGRQTGLPPRRVGRGKEVPHSNHPYPARRRGAPRQSNYGEIKGSLAQRRQVQRISAASRSAWGRCCSHTISWSTPWHPPRSRPVRAPCLPRSRQSRPLHSCCRGTDLGGAFERCDHLCCGRYLCNRAEICLNAAHKNRDQPACFLLRSALAPVGFHLKNAACGGLA